MEVIYFTKEEQDSMLKLQLETHFGSRLGFISSHNGLRRGSTHVLMGTPGGGKSTLVRTLIRDFLFHPANQAFRVVVLLSEETCAEYKTQLAYGLESHEPLKRGVLISEQEHLKEKIGFFLDRVEMLNPHLFIYDNLTTSRFYEGPGYEAQGEVFAKIKNLTKKINCATVAVCHTSSEIGENFDGLIQMSHVRGSKNVVNAAEFFYILQRFIDKDTGHIYPTIKITKHRGQDLIEDLYYLIYDKRLRAYVGDKHIKFSDFKEYFDKRRSLRK